MSLSAGQQRILDGIAGTLQARDPRLASLFSIFTRLTRHEPMPWIEQLTVRAGRLPRAMRRLARAFPALARLRPVAVVPLALAAMVGLLVLAPMTGSQRACAPSPAASAGVRLAARVGICETARTAGYAGR